jgi:hypothetical protein
VAIHRRRLSITSCRLATAETRSAFQAWALSARFVLLAATIFFGTIAAVPVDAAPRASTPISFYKTLAGAVTDLRGRILLYFNDCGHAEGCVYRTSSHAAGGVVDWRISPNTVATVVVDYEQAHLVKASIDFSKPVHLWLHTDQGSSFSISHVEYDADGHLISDDSKPDNPNGYHYAGATRTHRILELTTDPAQLLVNHALANVGGAGDGPIASCDAGDQHCSDTSLTSMFYELEIKSSAASPGLQAVLGPVQGNARALTLVAPQSDAEPANYIDLAEGSCVTLDSVQYFTDDHSVTGRVVNIKLNVNGGQLGTNNMLLLLTAGSTFSLSDIAFTHISSPAVVNTLTADDGSLDVPNLGSGSTFYISQGSAGAAGDSFVITREGTSLHLRHLNVRTGDDGRFGISWDNSSREVFQCASGRLNIGAAGFVNLGPGTISSNLSGQWTQGAAPHVVGSNGLVDVTITGGTLDINSLTKLPLGGGHIVGYNMSFDSSQTPVVTGTLSTFTLSIASNSTVTIPGGFAVVTNGNATLSNDPSSRGLNIVVERPYPIGQYVLNLPFSRLGGTSVGDFGITNGSAVFPIEALRDGTIRTPAAAAWTFSGTFIAAPQGASQPLSLALTVSDGVFNAPQGVDPTFAGHLKGSVMPGFDFAFVTAGQGLNGQPTIADHNDMSIYPVAVDFSIPVPAGGRTVPVAAIPSTAISVANNVVKIDAMKLTIPFVAVFPAGKGEHEDIRDPNSADGTHGDSEVAHDKVHTWQEVLQDKNLTGVGPLGCTIHLYLGPTTNTGTLDLTLQLSNKVLNVGVSQLELTTPFVQGTHWDKDGCKGTLVATIAGAILGALTLGPGGAVAAAAGGFVVGGAVNQRVDAIISERIGEFISGYQKSWTIQFPQ